MPEVAKHSIIAFYGNLPISSAPWGRIDEDRSTPYKAKFRLPEGMPIVKEDYDSPEIAAGSIAYHPIFGTISFRAPLWRFSTERFMSDLAAADNNPAIIAHIIHVDSCGGEAFGCHEAFEYVKNLTKPCYAVIDTVSASAGYYLSAGCKKIFASSIFSEIGCIGVMCTMYDDAGLLKNWGIAEHEYYSNYSPLKNKVFNDARKGDGEEFVKRFLDPMAFQFIEDVKSVRPNVSEEALQGKTYYSTEALPAGLVDGENTLEEVVEMILKQTTSKQAGPSIDINTINF